MPKLKKRPRNNEERLLDKLLTEVAHEERGFYDSLSTNEKKLALAVLEDYLSAAPGDARKQVLDAIWEVDYLRRPVPVREFIQNREFLGGSIENIREPWIQMLEDVTAPGSTIFEVILGGALGIGKSLSSTVLMAYDVYRMSCLRNPARFYGLENASTIVFGIYSVTLGQVRAAAYQMIRGFMDHSPYFETVFPFDRRLESRIEFIQHNIHIISGSRIGHSLGRDVYSVNLDEANFFGEKVDKATGKMIGEAYSLYNGTMARLISRFQRSGSIPGHVILGSSKTTTTSFTENRLRQLTGLKNVEDVRGPITPAGMKSPTAYYACFSTWDVFPDRFTSNKKFRVEVGDNVSRSRILTEEDKPREDAKVVEVPQELYQQFSIDTDQALRELAGVGTNSLSPFIRDPKTILDSISQDYKNPFPEESLPICTGNAMELQDEFDLEAVCVVESGRWRPIMAPDRPRFIHVDLSFNDDASAIGMGFHDGNRRTERVNGDGTKSVTVQPIIRMDFLQRLHAEPNTEIDHDKVFSFILFLTQLYRIGCVTGDMLFRATVQKLMSQQIPSKMLSVDRTIGPYMSLRSALREHRFIVPHTAYDEKAKRFTHTWFVQETSNLIFDRAAQKVDHPDFNPDKTDGSKELGDCSAGICEEIHNRLEKGVGGTDTKQASVTQQARASDENSTLNNLSRNLVKR